MLFGAYRIRAIIDLLRRALEPSVDASVFDQDLALQQIEFNDQPTCKRTWWLLNECNVNDQVWEAKPQVSHGLTSVAPKVQCFWQTVMAENRKPDPYTQRVSKCSPIHREARR